MSNAVEKIEPKNTAVTQPTSEAGAIVSMIERAARDPAVDIDKMERLMKMHADMRAAEREQAFNDAMALAQSEMRPIATDANNPQTRSRYASYAALDNAVRPIYTKHGFGLSFNTEPGAPADYIRVVCFASCAGHTRKYQVDMPADGKGAKGADVMTKTHAAGAAMTYGQRYLLKMIFNIAVGEDKDGNATALKGPITAAEVKELQTLIDVIGAEVPRVLAHVSKRIGEEITKLEDIPAAQFQPLKLSLSNWAKQKS